MKKPKGSKVRTEYDFSKGVRGKYLSRIVKGTNVVVLDPDVAAIYPDSASVNAALRKLAGLPARRKPSKRDKAKKDKN
jgi:hypothetical protein